MENMFGPRYIFRAARAILGAPRPLVLFHKPTARCDCRCRFCDSWVQQPEADDALPSERILALLDRAEAAGMNTYTVWGGEPFLVERLPEWLRHARGLGMETVVCTAGSRLSERAAETAPHVRRLLLSLEAVGEGQDRIRATPGLFGRIVSGLADYRRHGRGGITLWSNLCRENADQVEPIARFAKAERIDVEFFPAAPYPGYNERLILGAEERREVFGRAAELKRRGFPIRNTHYGLELMASGRAFRCNIPRLSVQVFPDGRVFACEPRVIPDLPAYGAIDQLDFSALPKSEAFRRRSRELMSCNRCLLPCVANVADSLLAQSARRFLPGS
jgi:MoaA/NifB/PqqE/SkfB family radical SAM enzyme